MLIMQSLLLIMLPPFITKQDFKEFKSQHSIQTWIIKLISVAIYGSFCWLQENITA